MVAGTLRHLRSLRLLVSTSLGKYIPQQQGLAQQEMLCQESYRAAG